MSDELHVFQPDPELRQLVDRMLDNRLAPDEQERLRHRLDTEPEALDYCAGEIRFHSALEGAFHPTEMLWEEKRRLTIGRNGPAWTIERRLNFGKNPRRLWPWLLGATVAILLASVGTWFWARASERVFQLRNGDFEAMDLSLSRVPESQSILYWQETFSTPDARIVDLNRKTSGKLIAKSGRNVAELARWTFLNQVIVNKEGENLLAKPGLVVVIRGWYFSEQSFDGGLLFSLRFVAGANPNMIQYVCASAQTDVRAGGWKSFESTLTLPNDLWRSEAITREGQTTPSAAIDLTGKPLILSIDNRMPKTSLLLDDLSIQVRQPGH